MEKSRKDSSKNSLKEKSSSLLTEHQKILKMYAKWGSKVQKRCVCHIFNSDIFVFQEKLCEKKTFFFFIQKSVKSR